MEGFCKKCLYDKLTEAELHKNIAAYVNSLSPETKADAGLYKKRLALCRRCPEMMGGLCRVCGCFITARAAKKNAYCPGTNKRW